MRFELGLEEPDPKRAITSALTIAGSYIAGGLIPLAPYMITPDSRTALLYSVASTIVALAVFGYVKGHFTGAPKMRSSLRTAAIGGLAAGAAYLIAKLDQLSMVWHPDLLLTSGMKLSLLVCAHRRSAAAAQPVSVGVKVGVPVTDALETFQGNQSAYVTNTHRYLVGATVQLNLPVPILG